MLAKVCTASLAISTVSTGWTGFFRRVEASNCWLRHRDWIDRNEDDEGEEEDTERERRVERGERQERVGATRLPIARTILDLSSISYKKKYWVNNNNINCYDSMGRDHVLSHTCVVGLRKKTVKLNLVKIIKTTYLINAGIDGHIWISGKLTLQRGRKREKDRKWRWR